MSGIHRRRRPRPLKTPISRPARRSSRQRVIRPRVLAASSRRQPQVVSLSVSEVGGSGRRIMRNELNSPASATRSTMPKRSAMTRRPLGTHRSEHSALSADSTVAGPSRASDSWVPKVGADGDTGRPLRPEGPSGRATWSSTRCQLSGRAPRRGRGRVDRYSVGCSATLAHLIGKRSVVQAHIGRPPARESPALSCSTAATSERGSGASSRDLTACCLTVPGRSCRGPRSRSARRRRAA
jgi:hypothetical protein